MDETTTPYYQTIPRMVLDTTTGFYLNGFYFNASDSVHVKSANIKGDLAVHTIDGRYEGDLKRPVPAIATTIECFRVTLDNVERMMHVAMKRPIETIRFCDFIFGSLGTIPKSQEFGNVIAQIIAERLKDETAHVQRLDFDGGIQASSMTAILKGVEKSPATTVVRMKYLNGPECEETIRTLERVLLARPDLSVEYGSPHDSFHRSFKTACDEWRTARVGIPVFAKEHPIYKKLPDHLILKIERMCAAPLDYALPRIIAPYNYREPCALDDVE